MKKIVPLSRLLLPVLPVLAALVMASCTRHSEAWPQLLEAEKLLETNLPTAGAMIDSVDASLLHGEDAALYAILKTQADYKRYLPLTSDSLPRLATDYYGTPYRKNFHAAMAWYSLGCYYTEQHADVAAYQVYLRAKELFPDTLSRYHALCYQNIGKHLYLHGMPQQAIPYLKTFRCHPACIADSSLISNADYCLGVAYLRNIEFQNAELSFYSVLNNSHASRCDSLDAVFQLAKLLYNDRESYGASFAFIDKYVGECTFLHQLGALWSLKGDIFYQFNELDSAFYYYKRALSETNDIYTRCDTYRQLLNLAPLLHDTDSVLYYTAQYDSLFSVITSRNQTDEMKAVEEQFYNTCSAFNRRIKLMLAIGISLLFVIILLLLYYCKRTRAHLSNQSPKSLEEKHEPITLAREAIIRQCIDRMRQVDSFKLLLGAESTRQPLENLSFNQKNALEHSMVVIFSEVEEALIQDCDNVNHDDAVLCMYMLLGLSSTEIAQCSRFSIRSIASRKYRLRSKLTGEWLAILFDASTELSCKEQ